MNTRQGRSRLDVPELRVVLEANRAKIAMMVPDAALPSSNSIPAKQAPLSGVPLTQLSATAAPPPQQQAPSAEFQRSNPMYGEVGGGLRYCLAGIGLLGYMPAWRWQDQLLCAVRWAC